MRPTWRAFALLTLHGCLGACNVSIAGSGPGLGTSSPVTAETFEWHGQLSAGQQLEVRGVNGRIHAQPARGNEATVVAERRGRRSDPNDVRIEVIQHHAGVTVCAVYPGGANHCRPGDHARLRARHNDVKVDFDLRVPAGVILIGRTINGSISARSLDGAIDARTVNGAIDVATNAYAQAETVNGSIQAVFGRTGWEDELELRTINGSVTLTLPTSANAAVRVGVVNGAIRSDLPLNIAASSRRHLEGTIGRSDRQLFIKTVNGSVRLHSGSSAPSVPRG